MKFFAITTFVLVLGSYGSSERISPLKAEIYKDNSQSFFVGAGERITFDMERPFQPLSPAGKLEDNDKFNNKIKFNPDYKPRILATKNTVTFSAEPSFEALPLSKDTQKIENIEKEINEDPSITDKPTDNSKSRWLSWSQWSSCVGGERTRIRACQRVGIEPCFGSNIEVEKCIGIKNSPTIAMATDPWSIEKEISHRIGN
uniref:Uncharacterized protein n=1 Tax=Parastrongyloides trichosuri TaxID=131310 RepID=A0A0N4ZQ50_PARTI